MGTVEVASVGGLRDDAALGRQLGARVAGGGENGVGCAEVALGDLDEDAGALGADEPFGGGAHLRRSALGDGLDALGRLDLAEREEERLAGEDGGGGDGDVGLGAGVLLELDLAAALHERALDAVAVELVGDRARARRHGGEQVLDGARVAPGEEPVDAVHLRVEAVVRRVADADDGVAVGAEEAPDSGGDAQGLLVARDALAVAHAELAQRFDEFLVGVGGGNAQGAEEVALAALVDAHVRLQLARVENVLVADADLAEHHGLEDV